MIRINLPTLPSWAALTDSERYHAGRTARMLQDTYGEHIDAWRPGCVHLVHFRYVEGTTREQQTELFAYESLLCALTNPEAKYAFRALLQVAGYLATLQALGCGFSHLRESYTVAQHRVEAMLRTDASAAAAA